MRRTGFNILFQSTLPAGGATSLEDYFGLPTGVFQSTLPAGGATKNHQNQEYEIQISIHAPRRGSDFVPYRLLWRHWISIHAPRRGSDRRQECKYHSLQDFNPRSPQGNAVKLSKILIAHASNSVCFFHPLSLLVNNKIKKLVK